MSAELVVESEAALAEAIPDALDAVYDLPDDGSPEQVWRAIAAALIASGAVRPLSEAVEALTDDATAVEAIIADQREAAESWGDPLPGAELRTRARTGLRALAAALRLAADTG